jgi:acetyltransferase-like isoleucine patch superfamily enzyme
MNNSLYSNDEISHIGFKSIGKNVTISKYARFYGAENMEFGNNIRIDDFCILSGNIKLSDHIHISAYTALYGRYGIEMEDYTGLSPRCTIFSATDDFSGEFMVGPMISNNYTKVTGGKVLIKRFSQIGCNCVILPSVTIHEGVAVGAMSLITKDLEAWKIYKGIPVKMLKARSKNLLKFIPDIQNNYTVD